MALLDILNKQKNETPQHTEHVVDPNKLSASELEYLLTTLKSVQIRGEHVEHFYALVIKLQNQYIALTKNV